MYSFSTKQPTNLPNKFRVTHCGKVSFFSKTVKISQKRHDKYSLFCIRLFNRCYPFSSVRYHSRMWKTVLELTLVLTPDFIIFV